MPARLKGRDDVGDTWTWIAIDSKSKLVPCFHVGKRDATDAYKFINDLAERLASRVQLTSDGLKAYLEAVEGAFGSEIDYAQLIKLYGNEQGTAGKSVIRPRFAPERGKPVSPAVRSKPWFPPAISNVKTLRSAWATAGSPG